MKTVLESEMNERIDIGGTAKSKRMLKNRNDYICCIPETVSNFV